MKRMALCLALALAMPMLAASKASAQAKVRIAIWEFENNSQGSWWFSNQLGPAVRNHIDTAFSEHPQLSQQFSVVERDKLALVLKEQGLGAAGALDPKTAASVGKMLGVRYIITGAIDSFSINNTKAALGKFGGLGGSMVRADALVSLRVIDTTTAERMVSVSAEGQVKKGGGTFRGNGLSRDGEWGIASEAAEKASKMLVQKFVSGNYVSRFVPGGPAAAAQLAGKIIKVDGERAWVNLGTAAGLKVGDKFTLYKVGEELIDPDSGAKLGAAEEKTGTADVTEAQEKFAIVKITGKAAVGTVVRTSGS